MLDVGCGEGVFTREIMRRYPEGSAVGIDVDGAAIAVASAHALSAVKARFLVHGDIRIG